MSDEAHAKQVGDEMRLLYSTAVTEIAGFKRQVWHVTNYAVLLYAAIATSPKLLGERLSHIEYFVLDAAAFAVLVAGWIIVNTLAKSILERRNRLTFIRKNYFTEEFRSAWRVGKSEMEAPDLPEEKTSLLSFFRVVLVMGFGATIWILLRNIYAP